MDDAFVAGAVERDHRVRLRAATREVVLGAAQIADAFLAGRRDELDGALSPYASAVDLGGEREHHRQAAAVVVDAGADESLAVAANREIGRARKNGVEMRADDDGRQTSRSRAPADDVAGCVRVDVRQAAVVEPPRDPAAALVLLPGRRGDLRDRDLRANDRVVARREARMRRGERAVRRSRFGGPPGALRSHGLKEYCLRVGRKARVDRTQQQRVPGRLYRSTIRCRANSSYVIGRAPGW